jgi:hypothetical protein
MSSSWNCPEVFYVAGRIFFGFPKRENPMRNLNRFARYFDHFLASDIPKPGVKGEASTCRPEGEPNQHKKTTYKSFNEQFKKLSFKEHLDDTYDHPTAHADFCDSPKRQPKAQKDDNEPVLFAGNYDLQ